MTKKDYIIIATAVKTIDKQFPEIDHDNAPEIQKYRALLLGQFQRSFKADNPKFDNDKFINFINN